MQCPNCGKEALNINGRMICLDCGIEIASGVTPAVNEETEPVISEAVSAVDAPFPNNDTVQHQSNILPESSYSENIIQVKQGLTPELSENESVSVPPEMTAGGTEIQNHQDLADAVAEQTVDHLVPVTPERDTVTDISSNQTNEPSEDTAAHIDFKMEPTIEEIAENNVASPAPVQEGQQDLLDTKADIGASIADETYPKPILGSDASVEEIVANEEKNPIFGDKNGSDSPAAVSDIPKPETPVTFETSTKETQEESYKAPSVKVESENPIRSGGYTQEYLSQVDTINHNIPTVPPIFAKADTFSVNLRSNPDTSDSFGYNADIMPARGAVIKSISRKIAIFMIVIINILILTMVGIVIKNKYLSNINEIIQVEPAGESE